MSQSNMNIAAGSGAAVRAAINAAIQALASNNAGTSAPNPTYPNMWWPDKTAGRLRRRSSDNLSWIDWGALDTSLGNQLQSQSGTAFTAGGTAPSYTMTPSPAITAYAANQRFNVTFPSGGTTGSNTINVNGLGALPLKQYASDGSLVSGVVAAGMNSDVQIVGAGSYALILNPLPAVVEKKILSISAGTVASNALTVRYPDQAISFHSATTTSGASSVISAAAGSLTIPSGATLGTVNGQLAIILLLALNNGGTVEPAVVNLAGGVDLSETGLISTTAISSSATAANVVYSANARTNVPYRVIGAYSVTEATAGTWATEPSQAIGAGGQAFSALMSIGNGQSLKNFSSSGRAFNTTYYNTTPRPIWITVSGGCNTSTAATLTVNGTNIASSSAGATTSQAQLSAIVPPGASYAAAFPGNMNYWFELR